MEGRARPYGCPLHTTPDANINHWYPRLGIDNERLTSIEGLKKVRIKSSTHKVIKIGIPITEEEEHKLVNQLIRNVNLFTWDPSDMLRIDTNVVSQCIFINPSAKPVAQRKRNVGEEKRVTINEEVGKLFGIDFITNMKYPTWMANMVLVRKAANKWRMRVDFTDLNIVQPKDSYPLPDIDLLIDGSLVYRILSFMEAYSCYNHI